MKLQRRSKSQRIVFSVFWIIMVAIALSYLFIALWAAYAGLKTHDDLVLNPFGKAQTIHWEHYIEVFSLLRVAKTNFGGMFFNSVYFSVGASFLTCMTSCMLAYVVSKFPYKPLKIFVPLTMVVITLPVYGTSGVMYKLYYKLGFINSYTQILGNLSGINMFFLYFLTAFNTLGDSYAEAARVDGAGEYTVFFRIMFPQVIGLFGALFITTWLACWNDYSSPLLYLRKLPTLASGIYQFELSMIYEVRMDIMYAAYTVAAIPPIILFIFFNKVLTTNVSLGGIKE